MGLVGKVALVTGGAAGIGAAIAHRLADEGASVVVADRRPVDGSPLAATPDDKHQVVFVQVDVTIDGDIERAVKTAVTRFGGIDLLINNAGILRFTPVDSLARQDWDDVIAVNLTAPAFCTKAVLPHFKARGGGVVVNVASIQSILTAPQFAAYAASKAGLLGLTRSLALELGPFGVRVNAVLPGYTRTDLFMADAIRLGEGVPGRFIEKLEPTIALRRIAEPEDVAGVVAFLCGNDAGYITGAALAVDAGVTVQL